MPLSEHPDIAGFLFRAHRPLLVLVGPTASGKTDLSLEIAEELNALGHGVDIINGDSRQLYRFLSIGTGKIRPEEMRGIPHHLFDVLDPKKEATAADYKVQAERVIADIHARGRVPFLVGGSMLYVSAIIDNLQFVDRPDQRLRFDLERQLKHEGSDALFAKLQALDPEGASIIDPKNAVYLLRALEVCLTSGKTLARAKERRPSPYDLFILGRSVPVQELSQRIDRRVEAMFAAGWIDEVRSLVKRGYGPDDPGLKSVGYREIVSFLLEGKPPIAQLKERIKAQTRQYAKRQRTWWRGDGRIHWM